MLDIDLGVLVTHYKPMIHRDIIDVTKNVKCSNCETNTAGVNGTPCYRLQPQTLLVISIYTAHSLSHCSTDMIVIMVIYTDYRKMHVNKTNFTSTY